MAPAMLDVRDLLVFLLTIAVAILYYRSSKQKSLADSLTRQMAVRNGFELTELLASGKAGHPKATWTEGSLESHFTASGPGWKAEVFPSPDDESSWCAHVSFESAGRGTIEFGGWDLYRHTVERDGFANTHDAQVAAELQVRSLGLPVNHAATRPRHDPTLPIPIAPHPANREGTSAS